MNKLSARALTVLGNSGFRDWTGATPERVRKHLLGFGREDIYAMLRKFRQCGHKTTSEIMCYAKLPIPAKEISASTRIVRIHFKGKESRKYIQSVLDDVKDCVFARYGLKVTLGNRRMG